MRWAACLVAVLLVGLAGCTASKPSPSATDAPSAGAAPNPEGVIVKSKPNGSQVLHLLKAPEMSTRSPKDAVPLRSPFNQAAVGVVPRGPTVSWTYTLKAQPHWEGKANWTVWVHIPDGSVQAIDPDQPGCAWAFYLIWELPTFGSYSTAYGCSPSTPGPVAAGDVKLEGGGSSYPDIKPVQGWTVTLRLSTAILTAPGATVEALGGSPGRDSQLTLSGLMEP